MRRLLIVFGSGRELAIAQIVQDPTEGAGDAQGHAVFVVDPARQIDQSPAHHAMDRRDRTVFHKLDQPRHLLERQLRSRSWVFAVNQPIGPLGIEAMRPVAKWVRPGKGTYRDIGFPGTYCRA